MRASFGKAVGTAVRVEAGQKIMTVETLEKDIEFAKNPLKKASMKLPSSYKVIVNNRHT